MKSLAPPANPSILGKRGHKDFREVAAPGFNELVPIFSCFHRLKYLNLISTPLTLRLFGQDTGLRPWCPECRRMAAQRLHLVPKIAKSPTAQCWNQTGAMSCHSWIHHSLSVFRGEYLTSCHGNSHIFPPFLGTSGNIPRGWIQIPSVFSTCVKVPGAKIASKMAVTPLSKQIRACVMLGPRICRRLRPATAETRTACVPAAVGSRAGSNMFNHPHKVR